MSTRRDDAPIDHLLDRINKDFGGDMADLLGVDWETIIGPALADAWIEGSEDRDRLAARLAEAEQLIERFAGLPLNFTQRQVERLRDDARAFLGENTDQ